MPTILLFDIDGTLVLTGGAGHRAMVGAFRRVHGKDDIFEGVSFAGMTDRAILRHGLHRVPAMAAVAASTTMPDEHIETVLEVYLELLETELDRAHAHYRILPGVGALLESLVGTPDVAIGLGTGNVRRGAHAKLARGALDGAFTFGGYGCDAEDRTELLLTGARRGADLLGAPLADCRVVVIGDTPKDVAAAKGIGAPCIGVGTGGFTVADLQACGAHRVFATLAEDGVRDALFSANNG